MLVLVFGLTTTAALAQESPAEDPKAVHALCAAANAILASQGDGGLLDQVIRSEAKRHADAARHLGATNKDLQQFVQALGLQYNAGEITWSEITDLAQGCVEFVTP